MPDSPLRHDGSDLLPRTTGLDSYLSIVVSYENAPDECTIFPDDVDKEALVTTWVSAEEGSYVALAEVR